MNFNPFSDIYHSLWDDMTCRGIEGHDAEIVVFDTTELYDGHLLSGAWTYAGYLKCCEYSRETSLALNPTAAQLKRNPYLYIITEVMVGDCDES
jgi:hypothetical protein